MDRLTEPRMMELMWSTVQGEPNIHGYSGEAIDKLARFENFYLDLLAQVAIPEEMEKLRQQGKTKSVRFRELMGEKMVKANLISLIKSYGL